MQSSLLRGLFDTDGGISQKNPICRFTTVSQKLAEEIQILLLSLGIVCYIKIEKAPLGYAKNGGHQSYILHISGSDLFLFQDRINFNVTEKENY